MRKKRYKALPLEDERLAVITDAYRLVGGQPLPEDDDELHTLVARLAATPIGKRISGTRKFGEKFAGMRPARAVDSKAEAFIVRGTLRYVARRIELDGGTLMHKDKKSEGSTYRLEGSRAAQLVETLEGSPARAYAALDAETLGMLALLAGQVR